MRWVQHMRPLLGSWRFAAVFGLLTLLGLVPLWSVRIPPMQDMWQHLALVDVIHSYDAPGSIYKDYFLLPTAPKPNLVYYYLTHLLAYLFPLEVANKLLLSLYVLAFPASFLFLLRSFGRSHHLSLFAFPLVYNAMFGYGFVSFVLGMPTLFFTVGMYRRFLLGATMRRGVIVALLLTLLYFTHMHVYLLAMFMCGLLLLMHWDGLSGTLLKAAPFALSLVFFVPWFLVYFVEQTPSTSGIAFGSVKKFFGPTYYKPSKVMSTFFHYVGDYFRDESDDFLFLLLMLVAFTLLIFRRAPALDPGTRHKVASFDLELLTVILGLSILALPQHIEAQAIVSTRHIPIALLLFFGWLGVDACPRRLLNVVLVVLVLICIAWDVNLVRGFRKFDAELDNYPTIFEKAEGGLRLRKVAYQEESSVITYGALWHIQFFYMLEKGGIADVQFAEYPHNPIQYRRDMKPPLPGPEFYANPVWRYFEYLLVRKSSSPPLKPVKDSIDLVADVKDWALYRVRESPVPRGPDTNPVASGRSKGFNIFSLNEVHHVPMVVRPDIRLPGLRRGLFDAVRGVRWHGGQGRGQQGHSE